MDIPNFNGWVQFKDYKCITGVGLRGVYILAHFSHKPSSPPKLTSANIIYVGETTGQTIAKRLYQFSQSAFFAKRGHSGGLTYSNQFLKGVPNVAPPENLYVAILPVDRPEKEGKAFIKLIERAVIWEFFKKNGDYPACNTA
ncbi:hypothetical protein [Aestuariirhabdus litorea]|uniref:GIY-YIG nuclease family protein n=1 Tax=Aestuariirhabdus litorea TaxID=2528527 RepID=A0A3P3VQ19_9GAMM|nr:hypothetical protein [Aestuariirhabdus litorea]RRJ82903.1 hypothetical protein D0544_13720 [Aestuariirhabdus litorea]RWW93062.1 hypothetical protein DZC74_13695 [Endozoicomonadaceae bacterium GTF-13]